MMTTESNEAFLARYADNENWYKGLLRACQTGNLYMVKYMVYNGDLDHKYDQLVESNVDGDYHHTRDIHVVNINEYKANTNQLNGGLKRAVYRGSLEIVQFLVECGSNNYDRGLKIAALSGQIDIAEFLIENGARNLNVSLVAAASKSDEAMINLLIDNGANDFDGGFCAAAYQNNIKLATFFINHGATDTELAFSIACIKGHSEMIRFLLEADKILDLDIGLEKAIRLRHDRAVALLITMGGGTKQNTINEGFQGLVSSLKNYDLNDVEKERYWSTLQTLVDNSHKTIHCDDSFIMEHLVLMGCSMDKFEDGLCKQSLHVKIKQFKSYIRAVDDEFLISELKTLVCDYSTL